MSRLELLYTCVANLARLMKKLEETVLPEGLLYYTKDDDHNRVLYHNRSEDTDFKTEQILKNAVLIISACGTSELRPPVSSSLFGIGVSSY